MPSVIAMTNDTATTLAATFLNPARLHEPFLRRPEDVPACTREVATLSNLLATMTPGANGSHKPITAHYREQAVTWAYSPENRSIVWTDTMFDEPVLRWWAGYVIVHEWGHDAFTSGYTAPAGVGRHVFHNLMNGAEDIRMEDRVADTLPAFRTLADLARDRVNAMYVARLTDDPWCFYPEGGERDAAMAGTPSFVATLNFLTFALMDRVTGRSLPMPADWCADLTDACLPDFRKAVQASATGRMVPHLWRVYERIRKACERMAQEQEQDDPGEGEPQPGEGEGEPQPGDPGDPGEGEGEGGSAPDPGDGCRCGTCGQRVADPAAMSFAVATPGECCPECGSLVPETDDSGEGEGEGTDTDPGEDTPTDTGTGTDEDEDTPTDVTNTGDEGTGGTSTDEDEGEPGTDEGTDGGEGTDPGDPDDPGEWNGERRGRNDAPRDQSFRDPGSDEVSDTEMMRDRIVSERDAAMMDQWRGLADAWQDDPGYRDRLSQVILPAATSPDARRMMRSMRKVLADNADGRMQHGRERGRLDVGRVHRVMAGHRDVFRERVANSGVTDWSIVIAMDVSWSMMDRISSGPAAGRQRHEVVRDLTSILLAGLDRVPGVRVALVPYALDINLACPFGTSAQVMQRVAAHAPLNGHTNEGVALLWAMRQIAQQRTEGKMIVVLTDGGPTDNGLTDEVVREAHEAGILTVGVGLNDPDATNPLVPTYHPVHAAVDFHDATTVVPAMVRRVIAGR